ncbi:hypothetical protein CI109_106675 [Kwoniella shandongensis]|uniref:Uncharacterized protein n=1 Tax=Kwoniella shandongensis TaxID=1734106 RepID=A0A5M6BR39_9TREE|nr:uncharacterized protein CI109_006413 [Kwoniella shandongensis]KAA5525243.1 hypothetical protein CI109_006413 [Kwoniella shandongensis]
MSLHLDYAEISRQARRIVDANRARTVIDQVTTITPSPSPSSSSRRKLKYTRSTTGCLSCRSHKVKCDETIPACLRCVASQRGCEYPPPGEMKSGKKRAREGSVGGEKRARMREEEEGYEKSIKGRMSASGAGQRQDSSSTDLGGYVRMEGGGDAVPAQHKGGWTNDVVRDEREWSSRPEISSGDLLQTTTPDFSFLNDFIPFVSPSHLPSPSPQTPSTVFPFNNPVASSSRQAAGAGTLPHFENITKSLLLNRRMVKLGEGSRTGSVDGRTPSIPPSLTVVHPRLQMVESFLQAYASDDALFEFGPSHRHRNLSNRTLTAGTIDVLSNAFPSPTARTLFHHYCNTASRILITMGNIGPNPLSALCTPLKLLDTNSAASAAIRMSMLSTGVAHFTHETADTVSKDELGQGWAEQRKRLKEMGNKFKRAALANITLAARGENGPDQIDSILAACALLCIRDVISADPTWRDNLEFALNLVGKKGGPQAMLNGPGYSFTRRYLLENLATHDVFSSFVTGKEPAVLGNYDSWWFDSVETSQTRWEWESVERTFGISRAMVDLVARIAMLDSQKRRLGVTLQGGSEEMWDVAQHFERESHCLLLELDIWGNSLNALPQHIRVTCGDYIYKYMAVVFILADILEQPTSTPRIIKSIDHILELLSEASAMRMSVMLIWPLLIAGVFCLPPKREKVRELFRAFRDDYCEDLQVARELLDEQWRAIDRGEGKQPWDKVMNKLGKYVLLI